MVTKTPINIVLLTLLSFLLYLKFFYQPPFEGQVIQIPQMPNFTGPYQPNTRLSGARLTEHSCEHISLGKLNQIYCSDHYAGLIKIIHPDGTSDVLLRTGGIPIGLMYHQEKLYICDAKKGLMRFTFGTGKLQVLVPSRDSQPDNMEAPAFLNSLDIVGDTIYFTDSSRKFSQPQFMKEVLDGSGNGRLMSYNLVTRQTKIVLEGLHFPNGIAAVQGELYFCQTSAFRLSAYNLESKQVRILFNSFIGYPDNIWADGDRLWVGFTAVRRGPALQFIYRYPRIRQFLAHLPRSITMLMQKIHRYGLVAQLDLEGNIIQTLHDPSGRVFTTTGLQVLGKKMYITSLEGKLAILDQSINISSSSEQL